jgi:hypothetical protein
LYCEELLAPRPNPKLEEHPLSTVHNRLLCIFAATLRIRGRSRNLRAPCRGDRDLLITTTIALSVRIPLGPECIRNACFAVCIALCSHRTCHRLVVFLLPRSRTNRSPYNRPRRAQRGSRGIALLILDLGARRRWVESNNQAS